MLRGAFRVIVMRRVLQKSEGIFPKKFRVNFAGAFFGECSRAFSSGTKEEDKINPQKSIHQCAAINGGGKREYVTSFCFCHLCKEKVLSPFWRRFWSLFCLSPFLPPHFDGRVTPAELTNQNFGTFTAKICTARIWPCESQSVALFRAPNASSPS